MSIPPKHPIAVIPVIDIRQGVTVHAVAGQRDRYAPIVTPLSATVDPVDVARGLLGTVPARTLYVADLDGIEGRGADRATLLRLREAFVGIEIWVDAGFTHASDVHAFLREGLGKPVLGSESQTDDELVRTFRDQAILSLDFRGDLFVGPQTLRDDPSSWPRDVIVMTLAKVGTGAGPDRGKLAAIAQRAPEARLYAAGGLRGPEDLAVLSELGIAGVLVASALHNGRLRREHISAAV